MKREQWAIQNVMGDYMPNNISPRLFETRKIAQSMLSKGSVYRVVKYKRPEAQGSDGALGSAEIDSGNTPNRD